MDSKGVEMGLVLALLVVVRWGKNTMAQSGCTTAVLGMSPCLNYISGNTSIPSSSCCSQLGTVVQSQPECLCLVLSGGSAALGYTLNQTQAVTLPGACNLQTPPISQCTAGNGPTSADTPTSSPVGSPTDSSDETPEIPGTPSAGGGSKTVPSTDGTSYGSSNIKVSFNLVFFALVVASYIASTATRF